MDFHAQLVFKSQDPKTPDKWTVTIDGFVTPYTKGTGLREGYKLPYGGRTSLYDLEQWQAKSKPVDPTEDEVLQSLASDASCFLDSRDLNDFAANFGDPKDFQGTLDAWEGCRRAAEFFQRRGLNWQDYTEQAYEDRKATA